MGYHHGDLRRALLDAARESLRSAPAVDLSIRDLARRVGVSANAPYRHFADREAVLAALAVEGYTALAAELAGRTGDGARGVAEVWSALATSDPALAEVMTASGVATRAEVAEAAATWFGAVVAAVEHELPGTSPERVLTRAIGCWAALHGLHRLQQAGVLAGLEDLSPSPRRLALRAIGA